MNSVSFCLFLEECLLSVDKFAFAHFFHPHDDIRCMYDDNCEFNTRPNRTFNGLNQHYCTMHIVEYRKQSEPLPPLLLKFHGENHYNLYEQCGYCPAMVSILYGNHLREKLRKNGWELNKDPKWNNTFMERCFRVLKVPTRKLSVSSTLLETILKNSYEVIKNDFHVSAHISNRLKEKMNFGNFERTRCGEWFFAILCCIFTKSKIILCRIDYFDAGSSCSFA